MSLLRVESKKQYWRVIIVCMTLTAGLAGQENGPGKDGEQSSPPETAAAPAKQPARKLPDLIRSDRVIRPVQMGGRSFDVGSSLAPKLVLPDPAEGQPSPPSKKKLELLIVPIPNSNPTTGVGLTAVAGLIYPLPGDKATTPPSSTMLGGFYTDNESWGLGLMQEAFLANDRYRLKAGGGYVSVNWDWTAAGGESDLQPVVLPFNQKGFAFISELLIRLTPHFYLGPTFSCSTLNTSYRAPGELPDIPEDNELQERIQDALSTRLSQIGLRGLWDSRDNTFYPRRGWYSEFEVNIYRDTWGSEFNYEVYMAAVNRYIGLSPRQVLALRGYGRFAYGDMPFFAQSALGVGPDLRGYSFGEHMDNLLLAVQAEYRRDLFWRLGAVAFAGAGEVAPELGDFSLDKLLPSYGAGLRLRLSKEYGINLRVDVAFTDDDHALLLGVFEAF
jgi:hypothetical protein